MTASGTHQQVKGSEVAAIQTAKGEVPPTKKQVKQDSTEGCTEPIDDYPALPHQDVPEDLISFSASRIFHILSFHPFQRFSAAV